jgi:hypothetical protein
MNDHKQSAGGRTWYRFTLRSLILLLTIACIWLAIVFNQCRRQRRAVESIVNAGGQVTFDYQAKAKRGEDATPPGPPWLRSLIGEEMFRTPACVIIRGDGIDDAFLAVHLPGVRSVEILSIKSDLVTDKAMANVAELRKLKWLSIDSSQITDMGLADLPSIDEWEVFALDCPRVTDAGMTHVAALKRIDTFVLNCERLTPSGIRQLNGLAGVREFRSMRDAKNREASGVQLSSGEFAFVSTPISEALNFVAQRFAVPINAQAMPADIKSKPFTFSAKSISFADLLDQLLQPEQLGFVVENGGIKITSKEAGRAGRAGIRAACETFPNAETVLVDW